MARQTDQQHGKRQRELAKKQKRDEKNRRRLEKKNATPEDTESENSSEPEPGSDVVPSP